METHNIKYQGVDYEVKGNYDEPENETGYKGGFSWMKILINDQDVSDHLKNSTIEKLVELVIEENY